MIFYQCIVNSLTGDYQKRKKKKAKKKKSDSIILAEA